MELRQRSLLQGGGTAAALASQLAEQLAPWREGAAESVRPQRIAPNPDLPRPAPIFMRPAARPKPSGSKIAAAATGAKKGSSTSKGFASSTKHVETTVSCAEAPAAGHSSGRSVSATPGAGTQSGRARALPEAQRRSDSGRGRGAGRGAAGADGGRSSVDRVDPDAPLRGTGTAAQVHIL